MLLNKLLEILNPLIIQSNIPQNLNLKFINNFTIDSRKINEDDCFIPLKGENTDGHIYIQDAINKGAICSLSSSYFNIKQKLPQKYHNRIIIIKTNGLNAIKKIAKYKTQKYIKKHIFAITGTSGKTTTKELLTFILKALKYPVFAPQGGLNGEIGTSISLANLKKQYDFGVLEFATANFGEIKSQNNVAKPDTAILISIGHAHTLFFKNIQGVKKAKGEIFLKAKKAVLPASLYNEYKKLLPDKTITFGYTNKADIKINDVKIVTSGTTGNITYKDKTYSIILPIYHAHIFENLGAALGALIINNYINDNDIKRLTLSLKEFHPPVHRGRIKHYKYKNTKITLADYTYNANEISIKNTIDTLRKIRTELPIILYLGDVLELGKLAKSQHKKFALLLTKLKSHIKYILFQGNLMKITYETLRQKVPSIPTFHHEIPQQVHNKLNKIITKYKHVFIWAIGSHGMKTWEITNDWNEINEI